MAIVVRCERSERGEVHEAHSWMLHEGDGGSRHCYGYSVLTEEAQPASVVDKDPRLTAEVSDRGLRYMPSVEGAYGGEVSVYDSSGAAPGIWLKAVEPGSTRDDGVDATATVLLSLYDARALAEQLQDLFDNHWSKS